LYDDIGILVKFFGDAGHSLVSTARPLVVISCSLGETHPDLARVPRAKGKRRDTEHCLVDQQKVPIDLLFARNALRLSWRNDIEDKPTRDIRNIGLAILVKIIERVFYRLLRIANRRSGLLSVRCTLPPPSLASPCSRRL
jgi:hypothetical protein